MHVLMSYRPDLDKTNAIKRRAGAVSRNGNEKVSRNGEDVDLDREGFRSDFKLAPLLKIENLELMGCVEFCFGMVRTLRLFPYV